MALHVNEMAIEIALKETKPESQLGSCGEGSRKLSGSELSQQEYMIDETVRRVLAILERKRSR